MGNGNKTLHKICELAEIALPILGRRFGVIRHVPARRDYGAAVCKCQDFTLWKHKRIWSLIDMLRFLAEDFCRASSLIGQLFSQVNSGVVPVSNSWGAIASELGNLERLCERLGLQSTLAQIKRVKETLFNGSNNVNYANFARDVMEVQIRLMDELEARTLFLMSADEARYFSDNQFAPRVGERFPDAIFDMDEAGKCYATERPTACVFHLMRVTEFGLHAIGRLLNMSDPRPNWEPIIAKIDSELKAPYEKRQFKGSADLLANASTHLHAVKVAWRNRAMHVDTKHTMEEAREIYSATCGLMRYLAENLPA
jgi:hypothetical protein